jgi:TPR repeat protein
VAAQFEYATAGHDIFHRVRRQHFPGGDANGGRLTVDSAFLDALERREMPALAAYALAHPPSDPLAPVLYVLAGLDTDPVRISALRDELETIALSEACDRPRLACDADDDGDKADSAGRDDDDGYSSTADDAVVSGDDRAAEILGQVLASGLCGPSSLADAVHWWCSVARWGRIGRAVEAGGIDVDTVTRAVWGTVDANGDDHSDDDSDDGFEARATPHRSRHDQPPQRKRRRQRRRRRRLHSIATRERRLALALELYLMAAETDPAAAYDAGRLIERGCCPDGADVARAMELYLLAADGRYADGMCAVGRLLLTGAVGRGVCAGWNPHLFFYFFFYTFFFFSNLVSH